MRPAIERRGAVVDSRERQLCRKPGDENEARGRGRGGGGGGGGGEESKVCPVVAAE